MGRATLLTVFDSRGVLKTAGVAGAVFVALGTITAFWENPLFFRMTPTQIAEAQKMAREWRAAKRYRTAGEPPDSPLRVIPFLDVEVREACPNLTTLRR